jgi:hypothetical protein
MADLELLIAFSPELVCASVAAELYELVMLRAVS